MGLPFDDFGGVKPRMIIGQTGTLTAVVTCLDAEYLWTPSGLTTPSVPLRHNTVHQVDVECVECGDTDSDTYCMPIIVPVCNYVFFDCAASNPETLQIVTGFEEYYVCGGDAIDWSTFEYNTDHLPVGAITIAYGGATTEQDLDVTVDHTKIPAGSYWVPIRVEAVSGIKSNWALLQVFIGQGCCE